MTIFYSHYGLPNTPPYIHDGLPVGVEERPTTDITLSVSDDRGFAVQSTLDVTLVYDPLGSPVPYEAIIGGVFQTGFTGSITANLTGGFDVVINPDSILADGTWEVTAYVEDDLEEFDTEVWEFGVVTKPILIAVRPVGRRVVELEFDIPVKVRSLSVRPIEPVDRYTPVDWIEHGGDAEDATNPANYVFSKVPDGNLSETGKAVDLVAIKAYEAEGYWSDSSGARLSTRVRVQTDYQMTARADYRINVQNLESVEAVTMDETEFDFIGYVVSHVVRNSLDFWYDCLSEIHRRDDREGTGDLDKFVTAIQESMDRWLEDIDAFVNELVDIDLAREEFLDNILWDLGNPFASIFNLTPIKKRKLLSILVQMYKEKGTCVGIVNAVQFFLGITLTCQLPWQDAWRLAGGSYPLPDGPDQDELGVTTQLGPSSGIDLYGFMLESPIVLTDEQRSQISEIAIYMKPAHCIFHGIIEP